MDVILLRDVEEVGLRGDVVSVARGYARNFLFPRRLAEEATSARVAELQKRESQKARHEAKTADQAQSIADTLTKTVLRFEVKTLVVPEGGELPSDEELDAMAAAEAAEQQAAAGAAETASSQAVEALVEEALAEADEAEAEPQPEAEQEPEAEPEPEWRADAEAALRDQNR